MEQQSKDHKCSQEVVLNTICIKLENIETIMSDMKDNQIVMKGSIDIITLDLAKRPSTEKINDCMDDVKLHKQYFRSIFIGLGLAWGLLVFVADKLWRGN